MTNLHDQIDRSFDSGPEHRDLSIIHQAGRRLVLRRRIAATTATVASVAAVTAGGWAISTHQGTREVPVASSPAAVSGPGVVNTDDAPALVVTNHGQPFTISLNRVAQRIDGLHRGDQAGSALDFIAQDGTRTFVVLANFDQVALLSHDMGDANLQDWLDQHGWTSQSPASPDPESSVSTLVRVVAGDSSHPVRMLARGDSTVVDFQSPAGLPANFAPSTSPTGVALVKAGSQRWYVLYREIGGRPDFITVSASDYPGTLSAFLTVARQKYASGEGLL